ncbi:MAG: TlpA family protein disulfide reductase [Candidatus Sumerlaeia bacterium]|nr:TlpA family protein disulfide reductase [Candidatus Sumerlaeia bacterium]
MIPLLLLLAAGPNPAQDGWKAEIGKPYAALDAHRGLAGPGFFGEKATLVLFAGSTSPRSVSALQAVQEYIAAPLAEKGVRVVAVVSGATKESAEALAKTHLLTFPVLADPDSAMFQAAAERGVPRVLVLDAAGAVRYRGAGFAPGREAEWRAALEAVAEGRAESLPTAGGGGVSEQLGAVDIRGRQAPEVPVEQWINAAPPREDWNGKFVLYDFWATWCGPCISTLKVAESMHHEFDAHLVTVAVSDEDTKTVETFVKKQGWKQPIGVDSKGTMMQQLQIRGIPHGFLADPDGKVVWQGHPMELWGDEGARLRELLGMKAKPAGT